MRSRNFFRNGRTGSITWLLFFVGLVSLLLAFLFGRRIPGQELTTNQKTILDVLTAGGLSQRAAIYWLAVSMFETGDFTSKIFKLANNGFGMKVPQSRDSTRSGVYTADDGEKYSSYSSVADSAADILLYTSALNYPDDFNSVEDLVSLMKQKGYYEVTYPYYLAGVKAKLSKLL